MSDDILVSRYLRTDDPRVDELVVPLHPAWWSRPYEYAWAAEFAEPHHRVLDAACGISHPFKLFLARLCRTVDACDLDPRITDVAAILKDLAEDLGPYDATCELEKMSRTRADITTMPYRDRQFDRVFCISTLEHLTETDAAKALTEFRRVLAPGGLAILTFDVPPRAPDAFAQLVRRAALAFAGPFETREPEHALLQTAMYGGLTCFRAVLRGD